jgi:hypothetical protein
MYIEDAKTETTNPMASYLSFEEKKENMTSEPTEILPQLKTAFSHFPL